MDNLSKYKSNNKDLPDFMNLVISIVNWLNDNAKKYNILYSASEFSEEKGGSIVLFKEEQQDTPVVFINFSPKQGMSWLAKYLNEEEAYSMGEGLESFVETFASKKWYQSSAKNNEMAKEKQEYKTMYVLNYYTNANSSNANALPKTQIFDDYNYLVKYGFKQLLEIDQDDSFKLFLIDSNLDLQKLDAIEQRQLIEKDYDQDNQEYVKVNIKIDSKNKIFEGVVLYNQVDKEGKQVVFKFKLEQTYAYESDKFMLLENLESSGHSLDFSYNFTNDSQDYIDLLNKHYAQFNIDLIKILKNSKVENNKIKVELKTKVDKTKRFLTYDTDKKTFGVKEIINENMSYSRVVSNIEKQVDYLFHREKYPNIKPIELPVLNTPSKTKEKKTNSDVKKYLAVSDMRFFDDPFMVSFDEYEDAFEAALIEVYNLQSGLHNQQSLESWLAEFKKKDSGVISGPNLLIKWDRDKKLAQGYTQDMGNEHVEAYIFNYFELTKDSYEFIVLNEITSEVPTVEVNLYQSYDQIITMGVETLNKNDIAIPYTAKELISLLTEKDQIFSFEDAEYPNLQFMFDKQDKKFSLFMITDELMQNMVLYLNPFKDEKSIDKNLELQNHVENVETATTDEVKPKKVEQKILEKTFKDDYEKYRYFVIDYYKKQLKDDYELKEFETVGTTTYHLIAKAKNNKDIDQLFYIDYRKKEFKGDLLNTIPEDAYKNTKAYIKNTNRNAQANIIFVFSEEFYEQNEKKLMEFYKANPTLLTRKDMKLIMKLFAV